MENENLDFENKSMHDKCFENGILEMDISIAPKNDFIYKACEIVPSTDSTSQEGNNENKWYNNINWEMVGKVGDVLKNIKIT